MTANGSLHKNAQISDARYNFMRKLRLHFLMPVFYYVAELRLYCFVLSFAFFCVSIFCLSSAFSSWILASSISRSNSAILCTWTDTPVFDRNVSRNGIHIDITLRVLLDDRVDVLSLL